MSKHIFLTTNPFRILIALALAVSVVAAGGVVADTQHDATSEDAEPNDSMENATHIEYGEEINGTLSSSDDVDYYALNATAGDAIIPRLVYDHVWDHNANRSIIVDVVTPRGEVSSELSNDVSSGRENVVGLFYGYMVKTGPAYTADVMEWNGTYYVRVQEHDDAETNDSVTYDYSLTVNTTDLDRYDPNENGTTATAFEVGETKTATFAAYDSDVYAVELSAGETYTVNLDGEYDSQPPETAIYVYPNQSQAVDDPDGDGYYFGANGSTVAKTGQYGGDGPLTFVAPDDGTYYVQVVQAPEKSSLLDPEPWRYDLTINGTDTSGESTDTDSDGLTDSREVELGTDPEVADTDGDGLLDGREVNELGTDPTWDNTEDNSVPEGVTDSDGDGLGDALEEKLGTDPESADTDDDGLEDDYEIRIGYDPLDPDTDDDGTLDGETVC